MVNLHSEENNQCENQKLELSHSIWKRKVAGKTMISKYRNFLR